MTVFECAPLRYAVVLEEGAPLHWQIEVLDQLAMVPGTELSVVFCIERPVRIASDRTRPSAKAVWLRLYERWTTKRSAGMRPMPTVLKHSTIAHTIAHNGPASSVLTLGPNERQLIEAAQPHFCLNLTVAMPEQDWLSMFSEGVWSYRHGKVKCRKPAFDCLLELVDGDQTTDVSLDRTGIADVITTLATASFPTIPHSHRQNRDQAQIGSSVLAAQACRRLLAGELDPESPQDTRTQIVSDKRLSRPSSLLRIGATWIGRQVDGVLRVDEWNVGVVSRPIESFLEDTSVSGTSWLPKHTARSTYRADPFAVSTAQGLSIVVEELDHRTRVGTLRSFRHHDGELFDETRPAVFRTHVSYPFLVRVGAEWWCLPETSAAGEVRHHSFDPETLLMEDRGPILEGVPLVDPSLFEWEGRWWLLGTDRRMGANTHLRAWWSTDPHGPWTLHARDPLLVDIARARCGGTPFAAGGVLHRPAQNCSVRYGGSLTICRIDRLDPVHFEETVVAHVRPDTAGRYRDGLHTLSSAGAVTLIDGNRRRLSTVGIRHEVKARIERWRGRP